MTMTRNIMHTCALQIFFLVVDDDDDNKEHLGYEYDCHHQQVLCVKNIFQKSFCCMFELAF
jgi:hypothetical protein